MLLSKRIEVKIGDIGYSQNDILLLPRRTYHGKCLERKARKASKIFNANEKRCETLKTRQDAILVTNVLFWSAGYPWSYLTSSLSSRGTRSNSHITEKRCVWYVCRTCITCNAIYHIYIYAYIYVYRSELKLRSVRTAIYGASLLCVALVSLVSDRRSREMPVTGAGWGFFLVTAGTRWEAGRVSQSSEGSLMASGQRKWLHLRHR